MLSWMGERQRESEQDKQTIQELVSDISHQVKTPIATIQMLTGILRQHRLSDEKRTEFLGTMAVQINKLDFLMQSLIKMSRLETGTFTLHMEANNLYNTIAQAVNSVCPWHHYPTKGLYQRKIQKRKRHDFFCVPIELILRCFLNGQSGD